MSDDLWFFLNKKTTAIPDASCGNCAGFEEDVPGNENRAVMGPRCPLSQWSVRCCHLTLTLYYQWFDSCVVLWLLFKSIYLLFAWVVAEFSWCPWDPKPVTMTVSGCTGPQRKLKTRRVKWLAQCHSEFASWSRIEICFLFSFMVVSALIRFTQETSEAVKLALAWAWLLPLTSAWLSVSRSQIISKNFHFNIGLKECAANSRAIRSQVPEVLTPWDFINWLPEVRGF